MSLYVTSAIDGIQYCKSNGQFYKHIKFHNLTPQQYYEKYITGVEEICPYCSASKKFYHKTNTYAKTCGSKACVSMFSKHAYADKTPDEIAAISAKKSSAWKNRESHAAQAIIEKRKATLLKKYGVTHQMHLSTVKQKIAETSIARYGVPSATQSTEFKSKRRDAIMAEYGVSHHMHLSKTRDKVSLSNKSKHYGDKIQDLCVATVQMIYDNNGIVGIQSYFGLSKSASYKLLRQNNIVLVKSAVSTFEQQIRDFVESVYSGKIVYGDRSLLPNRREIDIYFPDLKFAIECNGAYWHSASRGRDENYHKSKTDALAVAGIQLIHIYDFEWYRNTAEVINSLQKFLNKTTIDLVDTTISGITSKYSRNFLRKHCIENVQLSDVQHGIFHGTDMVALITINTDVMVVYPATGVELTDNNNILISYIHNEIGQSAVAYANRGKSEGSIYSNLGLTLVETTNPAAMYTCDYVLMETTINNVNKQYDIIWDCGIDVYKSTYTGATNE